MISIVENKGENIDFYKYLLIKHPLLNFNLIIKKGMEIILKKKVCGVQAWIGKLVRNIYGLKAHQLKK